MHMSHFRLNWLCLVFLLPIMLFTDIPLAAQYGQYPNGQPPGTGGLGIPVPRRGKKKEEQVQLQSTSGMLRRMQNKQVVVEADDHRILNFKRTDTTHFLKLGNPIKPADLRPGDYIEVEASEDEEGFLTAVNVMWQQDGTAKDRSHAAEPVDVSLAKGSHPKETKDKDSDSDKDSDKDSADQPATQDNAQTQSAPKPANQASTPTAPQDDPSPADLKTPIHEEVKAVQIDADDQGPPVLKHGGKAGRKEVEPAPASAPAPDLSARNEPPATDREPPIEREPPVRGPQRPEEVVMEKARAAAGTFLESLPNYVCQEVMTRYQSESGSKNWNPYDVISMALVYDKGQESYRNLEINGKPTKKKIEDLAGSWSTGEFGSVLADVFSPATAADFEYRKESRLGGRTSYVYDYTVEREHSHWRIMVASQLVTPPYRGSVWIDKETSRVLRIEMQATHIPDAFPTDKVEMATDYEFVRFGGEQQFLVPVHAESLGCQRDSGTCSRNAIDFRNYHKYSGESTITFDK